MTPTRHRITFPGSTGAELAAHLDVPAEPPLAHAVFAHCFTCSKDLRAAGRIADGLVAAGLAVLRFDFTGLGASRGDFADTDFSSNLGDLLAAASWLEAEHAAPKLLVGHSLGGAACVAVASAIDSVAAVATIGAPSSTDHLTHLFLDALEDIERDGAASVSIGGRGFTIRRSFLEDLTAHTVTERAAQLRAALLVLHSPVDNVVGVEHAGELFGAARHPKSFVALDGADHLLTDDRDATYAAHMIATWARRYVA